MIEINVTLLAIGQRITENLQLVVLDMLLQAFAYFLIQHVSQDTFTVHFLYQSCRNHSRTETRHLRFVAHFFELLCNLFLIVCRLNGQRYDSFQVFQFTLINLHCYIIFNF